MIFENKRKSQECQGLEFNKIKLASVEHHTKNLYSDYGVNVMEGKILTEFILKLDQFKSENKREATKVLGFLGDVGGFAAAVEGVFSLIG